jgi:hypothetical protein
MSARELPASKSTAVSAVIDEAKEERALASA